MNNPDKKVFSVRERIKSSTHAWRGIGVLVKTSHNMWGHIFFAILAIYLGYILSISEVEWALLSISMFLVAITEAINTSIEIDINLTSPEYHPYARDTKDVAAGAVLLSVLLSIIIACFIFLPKIINCVNI